MGHNMHTGSDLVKVFKSFQHFNGKTRSLKIAEAELLGLGGQFFTINKRRRILHSSRMQSASDICHSALVSFLSYLQLPVIYAFCVSYCGRFSRIVSITCST